MAGRGPQTFKKKQKEQQRKERREEKLAKKLERKRQQPGDGLAVSDEPEATGDGAQGAEASADI